MILPRMTVGNWLFWSIMVWIGFNFFWLKFVEPFVPQWVGAICATLVATGLFIYGPREREEEEEE